VVIDDVIARLAERIAQVWLTDWLDGKG